MSHYQKKEFKLIRKNSYENLLIFFTISKVSNFIEKRELPNIPNFKKIE